MINLLYITTITCFIKTIQSIITTTLLNVIQYILKSNKLKIIFEWKDYKVLL